MKPYLNNLEALYSSQTFQRKVDYIKYNFKDFFSGKGSISEVLEVGPGFGEFIYYLNDQNISKIDVIDNDKNVLEYVKHKFKLNNVFCGENISKFKNKLQRYDLIVLIQVLEHLPVSSHLLTMQTLYGLLKPRGSLIIVVPNANNPLGSVERYGDLQHTTSFTTRSLVDLALAVGARENQIIISGFEIPPYDIVNIIRIIAQKVLHAFLYLLLILNGGVYYKPLTPNIMLKISK